MMHKSEAGLDGMMRMMGPGMVDHEIRQAIMMCWQMLPAERRTIEEVEKEIRRLVDRALKDLREDEQAFGVPPKDSV